MREGGGVVNANVTRRDMDALTESVIGCAYAVGNKRGCGFLEKVYENALCLELRKKRIGAEQQYPLSVYYDGIVVGEYFVDILVERRLLLELKAVQRFDEVHMAQCINYLKATGLSVGLLLNFGAAEVQVKRIVRGY
jgi:GxxExxY protein